MATCSIELSDQPLGLSLHPTKSTLLAAGLVDGTVELHDFASLIQGQDRKDKEYKSDAAMDEDDDEEDDTILSSTAAHSAAEGMKKQSCRVVKFLSDGTSLLTGGTEGDLVCLDVSNCASVSQDDAPVRWRIPDATYKKSPLQVIHDISPSSFATGDEAGCVRLWDARMLDSSSTVSPPRTSSSAGDSAQRLPRGCVQAWKKHDDYISAVEHLESTLLATSADARLSVHDIRMNYPDPSNTGFVRISDDQEDELLSMQIMKNGRKVVCGTGEGVLVVFSFGTWGDLSDRFPGHPPCIDALAKVDEDTVVMGTSDGKLKVVTIQPDREIGLIGGSHCHNGFPIEHVEFTCDRAFVVSMTHDNIVRVFDTTVLDKEEEDKGDKGDASDKDDDDSSDDSMDGDQNAPETYGKARFKTENEKFFGDLT
jgi:WD repeat-containing protein 55